MISRRKITIVQYRFPWVHHLHWSTNDRGLCGERQKHAFVLFMSPVTRYFLNIYYYIDYELSKIKKAVNIFQHPACVALPFFFFFFFCFQDTPVWFCPYFIGLLFCSRLFHTENCGSIMHNSSCMWVYIVKLNFVIRYTMHTIAFLLIP